MAKKIGIDIRPYLNDPSGMGQYAYELTKHLLTNDTQNTYILFSDKDFSIDGKYIKKLISPFKGKLAKLNTLLFHVYTILFARFICDTYITTSALYVPALTRNFSIMFCHDVTIFKYPELHKAKTKFLIGLFLHLAAKNAQSVVAVSDQTKKDLLELFGDISDSKVHVIKQGVNYSLIALADDSAKWQEIKETLKIPTEKYILSIGTIEPRKNLKRVIDAFVQISNNFGNVSLVLGGRPGWGYDDIKAYIAKLEDITIQNKIIVTGFLTDKQKAYLYKHALFLTYVSLYEGFGIPVLEAMSFQIPFITSNISSLPEVAGDAGILVNPHEVQEIKEGMIQLLTNTTLRETLIQKEAMQIKKFDWNNTAKQVISLY